MPGSLAGEGGVGVANVPGPGSRIDARRVPEIFAADLSARSDTPKGVRRRIRFTQLGPNGIFTLDPHALTLAV